MAFRLATILNQSDNSDEADSGEHIDSYSESAEVLGNADNGETASTDEWVINMKHADIHNPLQCKTIICYFTWW